jgi:uncharacterized protein YlxP (DUF503 family)
MVVAISVFELHLPSSRSLKEKRRVVKSLTERVHRRHRISVAETDYHDLHQRAEIGVAAVSASRHQLEHQMDDIRRLIDEQEEAVLLGWEPQYLEAMG